MEFNLENKKELNTVSKDWNFSEQNDASLFESRLIEIMISNKGIGLASNQVGVPINVFIIGSQLMTEFKTPKGIFNPEILEYSEEHELEKEGCLSFPNLWLSIKRSKSIKVKYQDSQGMFHEKNLEGLDARCFQHEFDHLKGICFVDKVSKLKLQLAMKKLGKIKK
jgi:peptide deformylase